MIIRRGQSPKKYTVVPNDIIENTGLTWEARGLLVYLLSKPDHWHVNRDHLASQGTNGVRSVRTILSELEAAGYLRRQRGRDEETGRIAWECVVYDKAQVAPIGAVPTDGHSADGLSTDGPPAGGERAALVTTEKATTEEASTEEIPGPSPEGTVEVFDPLKERQREAGELVSAYWEWCHANDRPTPTLRAKGNPWLAVRNIVVGLLDAGYDQPEVAAALRDTRAYTIDALTYSLKAARESRLPAAVQALQEYRSRRVTG